MKAGLEARTLGSGWELGGRIRVRVLGQGTCVCVSGAYAHTCVRASVGAAHVPDDVRNPEESCLPLKLDRERWSSPNRTRDFGFEEDATDEPLTLEALLALEALPKPKALLIIRFVWRPLGCRMLPVGLCFKKVKVRVRTLRCKVPCRPLVAARAIGYDQSAVGQQGNREVW